MAIALRGTKGVLGLDVERGSPERPRLAKRVLTAFEAGWITSLPTTAQWRAVLALFCAKEAAFKALDGGVPGPPLTFRSLEASPTVEGMLLIQVVATPSVSARVAVEQNDELTIAIATRD